MAQRVSVNLGLTKNMGNFNSFRVDVGLEKDFADEVPIESALDEVFDRVDEYIEIKLAQELNALEALSDGNR